jgi:DUF1009 family protein
VIIGIDPDLIKSGIACLHQDTKRIEMTCLSFIDLIKFVRMNQPIIKCVYLEAGWLNQKASWHAAPNMSVAVSIGRKVGENHATGKIMQQLIEAEGVKVIPVRPTSKKLNAEDFKRLTKIETRTNQEMRDAAMLVYGR